MTKQHSPMASVAWFYQGILSKVGGVPGEFVDKECFNYKHTIGGWIRMACLMGLFLLLIM